MKISFSTKIFWGLVIFYAALAAVNIYLPQGNFLALQPSQQELPASKSIIALANAGIILVLYGGLGYLGLLLSRKVGWPDIYDKRISNRKRFLIPALIGAALGVFLIIGDMIFSRFNTIGHFLHPPFPTSLVASFSAGIGEEIMFRLFFISFWTWLISKVILRNKWQNQVFWVVAVLSALAFAVGHYPALMLLYNFNSVSTVPIVLQIEVILLNSAVGIFAAYYFRRYGFLAAVGVHFWTDIVWHVIWGLF